MKDLTYSRMALARLRANKRGYVSLAIGIFLSIFLISSIVLGIYSVYLSSLQKRVDKVGYVDMVVLDNTGITEADIRALEQYEQIGHSYITAEVTGMNTYVGYYDATALAVLDIAPTTGRMPERAGEIAIEPSALDVLDVNWSLGESVEFSLTAIDGSEETRTFTLVGFLPERSVSLNSDEKFGVNELTDFPAILTSNEEDTFSVGRIATHYVLRAKNSVSLRDMCTEMSSSIGYFHYYAFDNSGKQVVIAYSNSLLTLIGGDNDIITLLTMVCVFLLALLLSCCVGISGAMEGLLLKRREEIGVLRALGATRRQIRRMFGRENLLLALVLAPASIAVSAGAIWVLSRLFPSEVKFGFSLILLLPVALLSVGTILIAGYLPLVRASKLMPMSVIRDTQTLRRAKRIRSKKQFSAPKLIASRQVRFQSSRQIGAMLLVGLMLLCSGFLTGILTEYRDQTASERTAFLLQNTASIYREDQVSGYYSEPISQTSIAQIQRLDHVKRIEIDRKLDISAIVPEVPTYAIFSYYDSDVGILTEDMLENALKLGSSDYIRNNWENARSSYLEFLKNYQIDGESFSTRIITVELNEKNLEKLNATLTSGKIDVDAINAGREVIVVAPELWGYSKNENSFHFWYSERSAKLDIDGVNAELWAWNNVFTAGQSLPLLQLYQTQEDGTIYRNDETVTIGAILSNIDTNLVSYYDYCCILTTEEGLRNMDLHAEGIRQISVYLDGDITIEEEETLQRQLEAIARRTSECSVVNYMEIYRQSAQEDREQALFFLSIATVFFVVSVSMIVSSVTRRLQSEGRTIGMLRAVGADERAILGCYSGQMRASIFGGTGIALGLTLGYGAIFCINMLGNTSNLSVIFSQMKPFLFISIAIVAVAALCWAVCRVLLRGRIREIVSKSIIENIKEL